MESYIHLYETNSEFTAAYNGPDYKEPWLSLTEEGMKVNYNKPKLTAITFDSITWVTDVPAKGGTATKDNCEFKVYGIYEDGTSVDISSDATVTGELVVPSSTEGQRHEAGTLRLTASYGKFTATGNVTVYQKAAVDFSTEPLTFNILSAGAINWAAKDKSTKKSIYYKLNDNEWIYITSNTGSSAPTITVNSGDKLQFKGNNAQYATSSSYYNSFSGSTASFEVEGNIMSLIYGDNFKNNSTISGDYVFNGLFRDCAKLVSAENLILPATTLANYCYYSMFQGCASLTTAPELPANTLARRCYYHMFQNCTSLTTAPALPATTLTSECYSSMFHNCTNLTTAPELSATTLADYCCSGMFQYCTSLITAPALPATTLAQSCYSGMFKGCTSLTTAPELPATTLAEHCYVSMFYGCKSLTTAPALPATELKGSCYDSMFNGCKSLTTAPALPATTLADYCYSNMFQDCASLTKAPELPATTLAANCYNSMFQWCTSLTTAPALPANTLANRCYEKMFAGCTSLNYIKCLATNISATDCTWNWVGNVASTGTFVKAASMTSWPTGSSGIPTGWTAQDAS